VGADLPGTLCGARFRSDTVGIVEADEYKDAYRDLIPEAIVLLNVVANHEDHFGAGTHGFSKSFASWAACLALTPDALFFSESAAAQLAMDGHPVSGTVLGGPRSTSEWQVAIAEADARSTLIKVSRGAVCDTFVVPLTGEHAALAAGLGVLVGRRFGLADKDIRNGLATVTLPWRRQTLVHQSGNVFVYDDNARVFAQFIATIDGLRQRHPGAWLVAIVSPWGRLNRRDLIQWADAGSHADMLCVLPVGDASVEHGGAERPDADELLVEAVQARGRDALVVRHWDQLPAAGVAETVYVTAGYDSQYELFNEAHEYLRVRHT
jgi:UDP-N-acetylmuramate-alanine ligase